MKSPWILAVIGLVLTLALVAATLQLQQRSITDETRLGLTELVDRVELDTSMATAALQQTFIGLEHYLELNQELAPVDSPELRRVLDSLVLRNDYIISLVITDARGQVLNWTNSGARPNLAERDYFTAHTTTVIDGLFLSPPLPSIMSPGQWIFGISKGLRKSDGSLDKVLIAIADTRKLMQRLSSLDTDPTTVLTVLSPAGDVYARLPEQQQIGSQQPQLLAPLATATDRPGTTLVDTDNGPALLRRLTCCPLIVRAETAPGTIATAGRGGTAMSILGGALIAALLLWLSWRLAAAEKQLIASRTELQLEAQNDPLTGLRRWADLRPEILHSTSLPLPLPLLLVDLDHFRPLLERHGVLTAEDLLRQAAQLLRTGCDPVDLPARFGGDQFLLLLPGATQQQAQARAEKIRTAFAQHVFAPENPDIRLTVSIGMTLWDAGDKDLSATLERAQAALNRARKQGHDQVFWLPGRESWLERKSS